MRFRLAAVLLLLAAPAAAQAPALVRGVVVDSASGRAVGGLTVRLLDTLGAPAGGAISDAAGRFALRAAPGRYQLRVQRIGFRSTMSPRFALAGDTLVRLRAPWDVVSIAPVRTVGRSECSARASDREATADLWDEARKALDAAQVARAQQLLRLAVADEAHELDASGEQVLKRERAERAGVGLVAYKSLDPGTLERYGYVRSEGDAVRYDAPDADVLLSDGFVRTHCFFLQSDPARPGLAGLGFEPVKGRKPSDVRGVLWVDRATRELLSLDFTYTGYPEARWPRAAGGHLDFARLPSGAWMIRRWMVRAPVIRSFEKFAVQQTGGGPVQAGNARYDTHRETELLGVREMTGEVLSAAALDGTPLFAAQTGSVGGMAVDSLTGAPLAGARVLLQGTGRVAVADERGLWRMDSVPVGTFGVTLSHPAADTLVAEAPSWRAGVEADRLTSLTLALPPVASLKTRACVADFSSTPTSGAVVGVVTDAATGVPAAGATVRVTWSVFAKQDAGTVLVENVKEAVTTTDAQGRYRVCVLPGSGERVVVHAELGGRTGESPWFRSQAGFIARRDVAVGGGSRE